MDPSTHKGFLRTSEILDLLGVSRPTLWRWERDGHFPKKTQIGPNVVGYSKSEVEDWLVSRELQATSEPEDNNLSASNLSSRLRSRERP